MNKTVKGETRQTPRHLFATYLLIHSYCI